MPVDQDKLAALDAAVNRIQPGTPWCGPDAVDLLRELAGAGELARVARRATPAQRTVLGGAAYTLAWPIVFERLTRGLELRRGHRACAVSVHHLADECLDRFEDDVEAVVDDVLVRADKPVHTLEAWIASRLTAATVDGHRRQRGSRGALQRPRLPKWLSDGLERDRWLMDLAIQILTWAGVPVTAGTQLWPLDSWAQRRAGVTGDWTGSTPPVVAREVQQVLRVMGTRNRWYCDHVERPLGHKQAPVVSVFTVDDRPADPAPLLLTQPYQVDDARLTGLATDAVQAIQKRLCRGDDAQRAVVEVIGAVFGGAHAGDDIDRAPHSGPGYDERVCALMRNPSERGRIVRAVLGIFEDRRVMSLARPT